MSKTCTTHKNDVSSTSDSGDNSVTSCGPLPSQNTYSNDLYQAFPIICQKANNGVRLCYAVVDFMVERAIMESTYSHALMELAHVKAQDWSEQFTKCWNTFRKAIKHLAQERWAFASMMQTAIVPGAKSFVAQQEVHVQRLIAEGTNMRWTQQQMSSSLDKAKEKYDRKCQKAIDMIATLRKSNSILSTDARSSSRDSSPDEVSASKELTDKLAAGAGHLLAKMWDSTSAFGRNPLERQRSKLYGCLEEVIAAEKHYLQTVEYSNVQRLMIEPKINENLQALQLTEEERLEYLRDVLIRMQNGFINMFLRSEHFVGHMKTSANEANELADIEKGFQSLGSEAEIDINQADLSINPFYLRMTRIQAMSDDGHRMIEAITSVVAALITNEDQFLQSLHKLLWTCEKGGPCTSSHLCGASSFNQRVNFLDDEGATMANGWMMVKDQLKLLLEVHQEFKSLLVEPVSIVLNTMKKEYESIRVLTQENFLRMHSVLCNETATHNKLQMTLETRSQDFVRDYSCLTGSAPVSTTSYGIDASQAQKLLNTNAGVFNEKDRQPMAKLRQLAEEIHLLQAQLAESTSSLQQTYQTYTQEIEVFVSTYRENEKYRLQVGKNLLQSLAKAMEHMLRSGESVGNKALAEFEKIDPSLDIAKFIRTNRQPIERSEHVVAHYHGNDSLKAVMREYLVLLGKSSSTTLENVDKSCPNNVIHSSVVSYDATSLPATRSVCTSITFAEDEQTTLAKESDAGEFCVYNDNDSVSTRMEQDDDFAEAQSLGDSSFQKQFKLDSSEQVVESFSCALFLSNFPYHGRLYLTKNRICFSGWRDTTFVALYSEITAIEKKNTALIVPNAIEMTVKGAKVFFTSFMFRDECLLSIQQLRFIKTENDALMSDKSKQPNRELLGGEPRRRKRPNNLAAVAPSPKLATTDVIDAETPAENYRDSSLLLSGLIVSDAAKHVIPDEDILLNEFDLLLDEEVAFSVETAFLTLWVESDTFSRSLLDAAGMTDISLPRWEKKTNVYIAVSKLDTFDASRLVSYTHNKKYMVGPSVIPTSQTQRYAYIPGSRLIVSTTTCVSDVPYCNYFRVEHRWVFSATQKPGVSLAQVGIRVQWLKSTWLKKQIESTAVSEAKDAVTAWLNAAIDATKKQVPNKRSCVSFDSVITADPLLSAQTQENRPSTVLPEHVPVTRLSWTRLLYAESSIGAPSDLHSIRQKAVVVCVLVFIYTMYRVCVEMNQMKALLQESLVQQHQQSNLLQELSQA